MNIELHQNYRNKKCSTAARMHIIEANEYGKIEFKKLNVTPHKKVNK